MAVPAPPSSSSSSTSSSTSSTTPRAPSQFGIVLVDNPKIKPPAIPGPLFGFGALFQFGPKTYGPSWLNISLFAGLGFNVAIGSNPFLIYGDIYAVGHVQVKIAIFKGKLGFVGAALRPRLRGLLQLRRRDRGPDQPALAAQRHLRELRLQHRRRRAAIPAAGHHLGSSALGRVEPRSIDAHAGPDRSGCRSTRSSRSPSTSRSSRCRRSRLATPS